MRQEVLASSLLRRISRGSNLVMVGLVGGILCLFHLVAKPPQLYLNDLILPFVLIFAHLALSPLPWQWTGDDAPRAGIGRGFLQALGFDLVWVSLLLLAVHAFSPQFQQGQHPGPPPEGFQMMVPDQPQPGSERPLPEPPGPGLERSIPGQPGSGVGSSGAAVASPSAPANGNRPRSRPRPFNPGLGLGLVNLAFGLFFGWVSAEKEATEDKQRATALLLRQSQSKALQNQLEPHVLFNALNGLSELVHEDPLAAEEVIVRLADLYRMLTAHGRAALLPLGQERRLVEAYLAMEQMRFGERLRVQWQWPDWADAVTMPPLFLQPLVENAIKHGISPCAEGGDLRIRCEREGEGDGRTLCLTVENTGQPLTQDPGRGVGLGNLEARLALWPEAHGRFSLEYRDATTCATLHWTPEA